MSLVTILLAAVTLTVPTVPVSAQVAPRSARVVTRDLDLSSASGKRILNLRLARAAHAVCDTSDGRYDSGIRVSQRQCREAAIDTALSAIPDIKRLAAR